jgi:hypothetical protein
VHPGIFSSTALGGNINMVGRLNLSPSSTGNVEIAAKKAFSGFGYTGDSALTVAGNQTPIWATSTINLSDANPSSIPSPLSPLALQGLMPRNSQGLNIFGNTETTFGDVRFASGLEVTFGESGSLTASFASTQTKQALHAAGLLHRNDTNPLKLYALGGDISGLTLFAPKQSRLLASQDISDVALYLQNVNPADVTSLIAGRDILPYNPNSTLRATYAALGVPPEAGDRPLIGDIQQSGPGTLEVLAGRNFTLGAAPVQADGTGDGLTSIGNLRNPFLPSAGADIILAAGIGPAASLAKSRLNYEEFIAQYIKGGEGSKYLGELGITNFDSLSEGEQARVALDVFYRVLRDAGRNFATVGNYDAGTQAISTLFGNVGGQGTINFSSRSLKTRSGGDISIMAPGGGVKLGNALVAGTTPPGIITESGGSINIFAKNDVDVGVLRIFTLRGGDILIWSSEGNVAAGSASKTVAAAPPTRVIIDSQTGVVATDLAGLSTGGGIGVLATVKNVVPGNVDLVAPLGAVDAGDAGIRSAGNLTIAAATVLNAGNIAVTGASVGAPAAPAVSAPSVSAPPPPPPQSTEAAPKQDMAKAAAQATQQAAPLKDDEPLSNFVVVVKSYGGSQDAQPDGDSATLDDEERRRRQQKEAEDKSKSEKESPEAQ